VRLRWCWSAAMAVETAIPKLGVRGCGPLLASWRGMRRCGRGRAGRRRRLVQETELHRRPGEKRTARPVSSPLRRCSAATPMKPLQAQALAHFGRFRAEMHGPVTASYGRIPAHRNRELPCPALLRQGKLHRGIIVAVESCACRPSPTTCTHTQSPATHTKHLQYLARTRI
jgi:hypothetical protein